MNYFIFEYAKMRQQEIQQEFEAIHRARMSRPKGVNWQHGESLKGAKNVLFTWCRRLGSHSRRAYSTE